MGGSLRGVLGELLDIDGVTGGFNFQACWCTGYTAGTAVGAHIAEARAAACAGGRE